ncbi:MAG TPA: Ger(x)C family spore germination protein [Bacillota bacterium]|nr:Ger(x)C family spore germination protein [Bacillota bacterium]
MKNNFRFLTLILFLITFLLLSGCWDYTEYEDMTLLTALGFDQGQNGQITLTSLYTPITGTQGGGPSGGQEASGDATSKVVVNQVSSSTISCAIDNLQQLVPKQIFLGNIGLIVIGSQITSEDMRKIISFLDTTQYIRPSTLVAVSQGKAGDFLSIQTNVGPNPLRIAELISNTTRSGAGIPITILQLMQALDREGFEPMLPMGEAEAQPEKSEANQSEGNGSNQGTSSSGSSKTNNDKTEQPAPGLKPVLGLIKPKLGNHKISGLAVFKGYQMLGQLDEMETRGVVWLTNQKFNGHVCVNIQDTTDPSVKPKPISFRISDFRTQRKVMLTGGTPQVLLQVKISAILEEFRYSPKTLPPAFMKTIEKNLADSIKLTMKKSIAKAQSLNSDIFGFGFDFRRQHLKVWQRTYRRQWDQIFPDLPVSIKVKIRILTTGTKIPSILER